MKNWNAKQGVSERSVVNLREYANALKFYGANSSKQKSIVLWGKQKSSWEYKLW
ncbi:MAG: hypothetical protein LN569_05990 [Rickettsia endosymbiont of Labidopullus appendiculatus]|nr:hypothetical protein [Rickettsia endosymbiont of Labidopullus appendiculatus]